MKAVQESKSNKTSVSLEDTGTSASDMTAIVGIVIAELKLKGFKASVETYGCDEDGLDGTDFLDIYY